MLVLFVCITLRSLKNQDGDCWHVTKAHLPLYVCRCHTAQIKSVTSYTSWTTGYQGRVH